MPRLPIPGSDDNEWGNILNDFLDVEHNADGTLKTSGSLAAKANDSLVVHNAGNETITGIKTFLSSPVVPTPTIGSQVASKTYVDSVAVSGAPNATSGSVGLVQLAGDLGGAATAPTVPGLAAKAADNSVVHLAGTETITGAKNFTGGATINSTGIVITSDTRLSDQRTPTDGSVTDAKVASGAGIAKSKLAALNIGDSDVNTISQSKITGLSTALTGKVAASTLTTKGDLFAATGAGAITRLPAGTNGQFLQADSTQTTGLGWTSATDTMHVSGLVADGVTDDGPAIQTVLDNVGSSGNHSFEVVVEAPPTGVIYINSTVQIDTDNTTLRFGSPVLYGPLGRIRIEGDTAETPTTGKPVLTADSLTGSTTLTLNSVVPFATTNYIAIRGARDVTGNTYKDQKEYHTIASIAGNVITLNEPLESDYLAFNANTGAPAGTTHSTEVTRVISSLATSAPNRGDRTITLADSSIFTAGDLIQMVDDTHTVKPDGSFETGNYKHREMAEVKQIVSSTQVRIAHALYHSYDLATHARMVKILPVRHSTIRDISVTWSAMSTVGNAFEIKNGVQCLIFNCTITGDGAKTKSWKSQGFRQTDSYMCQVAQCYATDPTVTDSGSGYGATIYGSTGCQIRDCRFSSCRHSVLLFNGASGNTVSGCVSEDVCISDYDLHGGECMDNLITGCMAVGGDSLATDGAVNKTACKVGNTTHTDGDFHNIFSNMLITNYQGAAFEIVPTSGDNTFRDSRVNGAFTGIKLVANSGNTALISPNTFIENVDFADITTALTNVNGNSSASMVRGLTIENCRFVRAPTGLTPQNASKVRIRRNSWYDPSPVSGVYAITGTNITGFSAKQNDLSGFARGIKLTTCPNARIYANVMHDLSETTVYEDAGGNTGALFARNEIYGFTPITATSGTGPSTGGVVDIGVLYQADTPLRHTYVEWNFDPTISSSGSGSAGTNGTLYLMKLSAQTGGTVNNIITTIGTATTGTLTAGQNFAGIYDSTGALLAATADQSTAWATTGVKTMALGTPVTLQAGRDYYVALLPNGTGTVTAFLAASGGSTSSANANLSNAAQRFSTNSTGTSLPGTVTLSGNSGSGAKPYWIALS